MQTSIFTGPRERRTTVIIFVALVNMHSPTTLAGKRRGIVNGTYRGTTLTAQDLVENKYGRIVSKKKSSAGKKAYKNSALQLWNQACDMAVDELQLKARPVPLKKNTKFYKVARAYYDAM